MPGVASLNPGTVLRFLVCHQFTQLAGSQKQPGVVLATSTFVCRGYENWYALTHTRRMGPCGGGWNFELDFDARPGDEPKLDVCEGISMETATLQS